LYDPDQYRLENRMVCRDEQTAFLRKRAQGISCLM